MKFGFRTVRTLTAKRRSHIRARLRGNPEFLEHAAAEIPKAREFLSSGSWFTFDWLFKSETNAAKLFEGNYRGTLFARPKTLRQSKIEPTDGPTTIESYDPKTGETSTHVVPE